VSAVEAPGARSLQFGRKSEKLNHQIEQLELQLEDLQADDGEPAREMPAVGARYVS
jgi:transposase